MVRTETISARTLSSLKVGGMVSHTRVSNDEELISAINQAKANNKRIHIRGQGTNTFFGDSLDDLVVVTIDYKGINIEEHVGTVTLKCGGGEIWDDVVKYAVEKEWWGIENLSYIPGTIGAAPVQNIGAYGSEISNVCDSVRVYDREEKRFSTFCKSACRFDYRDSIFKKSEGRYVITEVTIILSKIPKPNLGYRPLDTLKENKILHIKDIRDLVISTRTSKLPDYNKYPNCGSFFKNPTVDEIEFPKIRSKYPNVVYFRDGYNFKIPAGWLIEFVAKMKGERVGDVATWSEQALVVVNYGNETSASDVQTFTSKIVEAIKKETGIHLEQEVQFVA